jgi:hypothetical protein
MVLIDEIRKLFEDLLLPELRAIGVRLDALAESQRRMAAELLSAQQGMEARLLEQLRQAEINILRSVSSDFSSAEEKPKSLKDPKDEPPTVQ